MTDEDPGNATHPDVTRRTAPNPPAPPSAPARFCTSCGAQLPGDGTGCAACAARAGMPAPAHAGPVTRGPLLGALGLYFTLLAVQLAGIVVVVIAGDADATVVPALLTASAAVTLTVLIWAAARRGWVLDGLRTIGSGRWYLIAAGVSPVTFAVATLLLGAVHAAAGVEEIRFTEPFLAAGLGWGVAILVLAVQPAVIEELAFRGVIQGALARVLNVREAVLVAAMMFAVLHLTPVSFPHLLLIGVAAGWLRVRSGSLYPPMLLHFLHNSIVIGGEWWRLG